MAHGPTAADDVRWSDVVPVRVGPVRVRVPAVLVPAGAPVDGATAVFEGAGVIVVVDTGPFADRLDAHEGAPGFVEERVEVSGAGGRRIGFDAPDAGTRTSALHVDGPSPVTVAVIAAPSLPDSVAADVLASVELA